VGSPSYKIRGMARLKGLDSDELLVQLLPSSLSKRSPHFPPFSGITTSNHHAQMSELKESLAVVTSQKNALEKELSDTKLLFLHKTKTIPLLKSDLQSELSTTSSELGLHNRPKLSVSWSSSPTL